MFLATPQVTYRPPEWGVFAPHRAALRDLVAETLPAFEAVAVTHDSPDDVARRLAEGFAVRDDYRPQLEANGSAQPGEDLSDTVFASVQFRPRGSTQAVLGLGRYGDVAIHWRPSVLEGRTTISPVLSRSLNNYNDVGGGLKAGSSADLVEIVTDGLIAQHGSRSGRAGATTWLPDLVGAPREQALAGVAALLSHSIFRRTSPEAIVRGAVPTADAIEAITILDGDSPEALDQIRAWAAAEGVPVHELVTG